MRIVRFANPRDYNSSPTELQGRGNSVCVYYNINYAYFEDFKSIKELASRVKNDFPLITDEQIAIRFLKLPNIEITTLCVHIPVEEFLKLKNSSMLCPLYM